MRPKSERDRPVCQKEQGKRLLPKREMPVAWREWKGRGGLKKKISTEGYFCPNEGCEYYGITDEETHALVGDGEHGKWEAIQDLKCQACGKKFTIRKNTVLYRLKTHSGMVEKILWLLALGVEVSALEEVFGVWEITIRTWLCRSGMQGRNLHERFLTVPELGKCALGTVTSQLYTESFETTPAGWNNGGLGDTWAQSSARKHTGNYSYKATDVPTVSNQWLTSPQVHIPLNQSPLTLQFWNYQRLDNRAGVCYDGGLLEVSTDGGSTWTQLDSQLKSDPYDGTLVSGTGNPLAGKKAWCGNPQNWLNSIVDLNAYAGQAVSFRFSLGTDNSIGVEGWYLDDVVVQSCSLSASLGPDSIMGALPGHSVVHNFILSNMGEVDVYSLAVTGNDWPTTIISTNPITVSHGTSVTVMVQVDVPASQPTASDSFTLTATSVNIPGITLVANGTTQISAIPGVSISAG